jgi:hypothetical protein
MLIARLAIEDRNYRTIREVEGQFNSLISGVFPRYADPEFPFIGFIDPYGHTIFSSYQMRPFLLELARLYEDATPEQVDALNLIKDLAVECLNTVDSHLRLDGM